MPRSTELLYNVQPDGSVLFTEIDLNAADNVPNLPQINRINWHRQSNGAIVASIGATHFDLPPSPRTGDLLTMQVGDSFAPGTNFAGITLQDDTLSSPNNRVRAAASDNFGFSAGATIINAQSESSFPQFPTPHKAFLSFGQIDGAGGITFGTGDFTVTRSGAGDFTVTWTTLRAGTNYAILPSWGASPGNPTGGEIFNKAAGSFRMIFFNTSTGVQVDPASWAFMTIDPQ